MTASNSFITRTSYGCPTDDLPVRGASKHDSGNRGTRLLVANESASDRAERLAVIARLRCIYSDDFISATYGGDHV